MISFSFAITNPFAKNSEQKDYLCWEPRVTKHRALCVQVSRFSRYHLFKLHLDLSWRGCDHAGPELELGVLGYTLLVQFYDTRHWNHDAGRWMTDAEAEAEAAAWAAETDQPT